MRARKVSGKTYNNAAAAEIATAYRGPGNKMEYLWSGRIPEWPMPQRPQVLPSDPIIGAIKRL